MGANGEIDLDANGNWLLDNDGNVTICGGCCPYYGLRGCCNPLSIISTTEDLSSKLGLVVEFSSTNSRWNVIKTDVEPTENFTASELTTVSNCGNFSNCCNTSFNSGTNRCCLSPNATVSASWSVTPIGDICSTCTGQVMSGSQSKIVRRRGFPNCGGFPPECTGLCFSGGISWFWKSSSIIIQVHHADFASWTLVVGQCNGDPLCKVFGQLTTGNCNGVSGTVPASETFIQTVDCSGADVDLATLTFSVTVENNDCCQCVPIIGNVACNKIGSQPEDDGICTEDQRLEGEGC